MSILQRYVVREMLGPLGMGLFVFTFVFLIGQLFRIADLLLTSGISVRLAGELILSLLPGIMSLTIPMAVLVAILLGVGRLAADREILAIRMSGVNLMHICIPILVLAGFLSAMMIFLNHNVIPYLNLKSADLTTQIEFEMLSAIPPDRPFPLEDSTFFFDHRDPDTGEMRGVTIRTELDRESPEEQKERKDVITEIDKLARKKDKVSRQKLQQLLAEATAREEKRKSHSNLIVADRGRIESNVSERIIEMKLTSGSIHAVNADRPSSYDIVRFDSFVKGIKKRFTRTPTGEYRKHASEMSVGELRKQIATANKKSSYVVEFWQRYSIPLACLAFALIAIPLGVYARPTGKAVAFAISFLLILLYYGLLNYGISLGKTGSGIAPFAIFFPNILLAVVGGVLLYRMVMK